LYSLFVPAQVSGAKNLFGHSRDKRINQLLRALAGLEAEIRERD
jgi:hypothetical protein